MWKDPLGRGESMGKGTEALEKRIHLGSRVE